MIPKMKTARIKKMNEGCQTVLNAIYENQHLYLRE